MVEQPALGFGGLLRQLRTEAGLTQEELAEAAGLSPRSVSDLERGIHPTARKDTAELLAGALGLAEPARGLVRRGGPRPRPGRRGADGPARAGWSLGRSGGWPVARCGRAARIWGWCRSRSGTRRFFTGAASWRTSWRAAGGRLDGPGILLVAGESGSGKSSLLQAGLLPRLAAGALGPGSERWPRRVIRPAGSPLRELAMQLAEMAGADPVSVYRSLAAAPDEAPMLAEQAVRTAAGRGADTGPGGPADTEAAAPPRLVLVVDQFEELFTAGEDADGDGRSGRRSSRRCTRRPPSRPARAKSRRRWWSRRCARISSAGSSPTRR